VNGAIRRFPYCPRQVDSWALSRAATCWPPCADWGLGTALADADNAGRIGQNGRREAEAHFQWDIIASGTENVYETV
jgi:hypothetical protein